MQLALLLYLASIAENLRSGVFFLFVVASIIGAAAAVAACITGLTMTEKDKVSEDVYRANKLLRKIAVRTLFVWVALATLGGLIPSRQDVYVMAAGYVALKAVDSDLVRTTADHSLAAIEGWLDKELAKPAAAVAKGK
ncbi:hypothetical protein [Burkholderia cenocepacia]|uniref:hypothetical protein n=1 Tax=Burkholderia cenocepacia TaxID=95486 RepID=UPI000761E6EC|nr:hypothetical protein [Burkholderia cenocepacia]KWU19202.1 hypothetical protein AS149_13230 [Burkholderia cenocepacia]